MDNKMQHVPIEKIDIDEQNERTTMSPDAIDELKSSMAQLGLIQPVTLRRRDDRYIVVAGARRTIAAAALGWVTIPAILSDEPDDTCALIRAHENLQREQLSIADESRMLSTYIHARKMSITDTARALGRSPDWVRTRLRYLELSDETRAAIDDGKLSMSVAAELSKIDNEQTRNALIAAAIRSGCSIATARAWHQQYNYDTSATAEIIEHAQQNPSAGRTADIMLECRLCHANAQMESMDVIRVCQQCVEQIAKL